MANQYPADLAERFWMKVQKSDGCWMWLGRINPSTGYGRFYTPKGEQGAHRVSYELTHGDIPDGLSLDHLCEVKACVNPDHLDPVGLGENSRRFAQAITHCPKGHPYDEANTRWSTNGTKRHCRTCERERKRGEKVPRFICPICGAERVSGQRHMRSKHREEFE